MLTPFHSAAPYGGLPDAVPGARSPALPIDADYGPLWPYCATTNNLCEHIQKRGLEPYVRYVVQQWKEFNL